jgi:hypothetical protein
VSLLDPRKPPSPAPEKGKKTKRARKGQSDSNDSEARSEVPDFVKEFGSSGWTRTSNPPVNRLMQVLFLDGSSSV